MRKGGFKGIAPLLLASVMLTLMAAAFIGWGRGEYPALYVVFASISAVALLVILAVASAVKGHVQVRRDFLRRLGNPVFVASHGPAPRGRVLVAVFALVPAALLFAGSLMLFYDGDRTAVVGGSTLLFLSLLFQIAAWMNLRDYAHWRAAWRESLELGEAKGRWVTISRAAPNSGHNEWTGML